METYIKSAFIEAQEALNSLIENKQTIQAIHQASSLMVSSLRTGGRIYACGNGGSMCDAMHFAEELSGKFRKERPALPAMAISDSAHLSCTANDFGYQSVFSRFVEGFGTKGDVLLAISTSGKSENIINAVRSARKYGLHSIALTGRNDALLGELTDIHISTPTSSPYSDRVQELHIKCIHIMIEMCERELFPQLY